MGGPGSREFQILILFWQEVTGYSLLGSQRKGPRAGVSLGSQRWEGAVGALAQNIPCKGWGRSPEGS